MSDLSGLSSNIYQGPQRGGFVICGCTRGFPLRRRGKRSSAGHVLIRLVKI